MSELDTVPPVKSKNDDEISLLDLFAIIWNRKLFVIIFTIIFFLCREVKEKK